MFLILENSFHGLRMVIVPKKWFLVTRLLSAWRFPFYLPVQ